MVRFFPSLKNGWGFTAPQNKRKMENQEEALTKYDKFRIELEELKNNLSFEDANNIHKLFIKYLELNEKQIGEDFMLGWKKGFKDGQEFINNYNK